MRTNTSTDSPNVVFVQKWDTSSSHESQHAVGGLASSAAEQKKMRHPERM